MGDKTGIEWAEATWNVLAGCKIVSPGCTNCYAMKRAAPRLASNPATKHYHGTVEKQGNGQYTWTGKIGVAPKATWEKPLRWTRPRLIFVNSTSDVFQEGVSFELVERMWDVMEKTPHHVYQILTKRPHLMAEFTQRPGYRILPNVWLGMSVEDQKRADERREYLEATQAFVRWVSYEPALGDVDWSGYEFMQWLVAGGETDIGQGARPSHPDWFRHARDWCAANGVDYFFKQWGDWAVVDGGQAENITDGKMVRDGNDYLAGNGERSAPYIMRNIGTKNAGRLLDGVEHNQMPARPTI